MARRTAAAVLVYYVYAPFGIGALSYNSMGIDCLAVAAVLLVTASKRWSDGISGFFFAMAVLCCPYLVILYILYGTFVWCRRKNKNTAAYFEECGYAETYRTADGTRILEKP